MGIGKRRDGSFYIACDCEDCDHKVDLEAKDFYQASAEARRLGWKLKKTADGRWVNFCSDWCAYLFDVPVKTYYVKDDQKYTITFNKK